MHISKDFDNLLKIAIDFGCRVIDKGSKVIFYPPDKNIQPYIAHRSDKAFHPLRRYLKNTCKFMI